MTVLTLFANAVNAPRTPSEQHGLTWLLPGRSVIVEMLSDYAVMRALARACV
jgi:hypothetical protein